MLCRCKSHFISFSCPRRGVGGGQACPLGCQNHPPPCHLCLRHQWFRIPLRPVLSILLKFKTFKTQWRKLAKNSRLDITDSESTRENNGISWLRDLKAHSGKWGVLNWDPSYFLPEGQNRRDLSEVPKLWREGSQFRTPPFLAQGEKEQGFVKTVKFGTPWRVPRPPLKTPYFRAKGKNRRDLSNLALFSSFRHPSKVPPPLSISKSGKNVHKKAVLLYPQKVDKNGPLFQGGEPSSQKKKNCRNPPPSALL